MHRYEVEDDYRDGYMYTVGICTAAVPSTEAKDKLKSAGAIQQHKQTNLKENDTRIHVLGSYEQAEIMSGSTFH